MATPLEPKPDYATWTSHPYAADRIKYFGRIVTDGAVKTVWQCDHEHLTRDEAQECAEAELQRRKVDN